MSSRSLSAEGLMSAVELLTAFYLLYLDCRSLLKDHNRLSNCYLLSFLMCFLFEIINEITNAELVDKIKENSQHKKYYNRI